MSRDIPFYELTEGGTRLIKKIPEEAWMRCSHFIIWPDHYREDNTCRCDDPEHTEMKEWGYTWSTREQRWV